MDTTFTQEIYYSNKTELSISEVADALLALEKVVQHAPLALEEIFEGTVVSELIISIDQLKSGSLSEKIKYFFRLGVQKNIEGLVGNEAPGMDGFSQEGLKTVLSWFIVALIFFGLKIGAEKAFPSKPNTQIKNEVNIILATGEELTGIDKNVLNDKLEKIAKESSELSKGSIGFSKPARRDPDASITFDRNFQISKDALKEVPDTFTEDKEKETVKNFDRTDVIIRATDKDSGNWGWGAIIPEFSDRRMRMSVESSIDLNELSNFKKIKGDVAIFYKTDSEGSIIKPHAVLLKICP